MHEWGELEAVLYARVSDDRDGRSRSTSQQIDEGNDWCEREGISVIATIIDDDIGASRYSRKKRDGYDRALELLQAPSERRRILVSWESSRAQRNLKVYLMLREICEESGSLWCYDGRIYDMSDPADRRRTAMDAVEDEYEVERTRRRVMRDMRDNAAAGRPHGKIAYGYRIVRDDRTGRAIDRVPDEDVFDAEGNLVRVGTATIVREIAQRLLEAESIRSITIDLNRRGIPAPRPMRKGPNKGKPGPWLTQTVTTLMRSPTYAGLRVANGKVIRTGTWKPLLTVDQHERLVALLTDPTRRTNHRGAAPAWLLSFIATCGVCGSHVTRLAPRGTDMYVCATNFCVARSIKGVDRLVEQAVIERLMSDDIFALMAKSSDEAATAYEEERKLKARLNKFIAMAASGEISEESFVQIDKDLRAKIKKAESKARAKFTSPLVRKLAEGRNAREEWPRLDLAEKRQVIRELCEVTIFKARTKGQRQVNPRYIGLWWIGSDAPKPTAPPPPAPLAEGGDPGEYTVPEVLQYLRSAGIDERIRIQELERAGQGRGDIMKLSTDRKRARTG
ncbi:recombinase family protein [Nocardia cyriacigeorgica]|uniref:recombinase family protein n=1 Tax=Nocardia cyriacigeorgica TaxID=135487 RepID=UPI0018961E1E|nr:recombinase family protein [Nocardia cyriacigeorgica]MBF6515308.1 recombinase family protein [Nocardia cyriacigeorgica]